jgi:predicted MFS family arabinose efflux permease
MAASVTRRTRDHAGVSAVLFLSLFSSQAALIATTPVLAQIAGDLGVSTALAGQLRTITGLAAGVTALLLPRIAGRVGLGRQLLGASLLVAVGSFASAAAPSFAVLALAQVPVGVGVAIFMTTSMIAAAAWAPPELRTRVLAWALLGQPAAWIVGMPTIGLLGEQSWRYAWLAMPLAGSMLAGAAVVRRVSERPQPVRPARLAVALSDRNLARWLLAELLANTAWAGTIVFAGALFVESYGASPRLTGLVLAVAAGAYVAGNRVAERRAWNRTRWALVGLPLGLAVSAALFGAWRPSIPVSALSLSAAAFAAGARTFVSSAHGLAARDEFRPALMASRAATMQFGYFGGSLAGGTALAVGGYAVFGAAMSVLFLAAAVTLAAGARSAARREARSGSVVASTRGNGVSTAGTAGGAGRRRTVAARGGQAAGAAGDPPPEREPGGGARPNRRRPLGRERAGVGGEDGADLRLTAAQDAA